MSLNPDIRDQAYQFFIEEAQELLQVLESGLLEIQADHSTPKVHELMRAAHSIKGGAASVELGAIELLAHRLEDFFKALYSDSIEFDTELEELLLKGYDCLSNPLMEQIDSGSCDEELALLTAEPVFAALEVRLEDALKNADNYIPSSNDLGVDIVSSIFEVDVVQSLEHLQELVDNPANYNLGEELQGTLDMFAGFAELFNLPGFSDIVQTSQTALANNSGNVLEIIKVTLADCTAAKDLVLNGDREQGGEVSSALIELAQAAANEVLSDNTEEFAFDSQDHTLWGSPTDVDPFAEDIFGTIPDAQPLAEVEPEVESEPEVIANDAIANIFGTIPDAQPIAEVEVEQDIEKSPQPESIEKAVQSIENIFESLPSAEITPTALAPSSETESNKKPQSSQPVKAKPAKSKKAAAKLSVKVDLERLERMNNLIGELTINRNSLSLQNEQLQQNVSELGHKFSRFREVTQKLREISDLIVLEQRSHNLSHSSLPNSNHSYSTVYRDDSTEFDSLEMDSYSGLYASIQNILEELLQLEESVDDITIFAKQSDRTIHSQRQMLGQMRDELMWVRMLPLDKILQRFPRTLRDLASKYKKPVDLKLTGTGVLVDKAVLEKLSDPLLHLLRNGFDHGIESTEIRTSQGKPANGTIEINAYHQGNQTVIEIKDDGKGLDVEKITQKGVEKGLISAGEVATATKERLYDLIFEPGFSTASKVSELSGRGVGMNIVRSQIETLKGKISVTSSPGEGSVFTLRLPLTLTIAKLLVCSLGSTSFAIPSDSIEEIVIPIAEQIKIANQQKFLSLDGKLVPIYNLREVLHYNCPVPDADATSTAFKTIASPEDWFAPLLLLRRGQKLFALEVASLISEQELVIKPYGKAIAAPKYIYGCTILGDGSLIPAFDGAALISSIVGEESISISSGVDLAPESLDAALESDLADSIAATSTQQSGDRSASGNNSGNNIVSTKTIMVVDDSTALRRTMALTLEKYGYRVIQKKDGKDALDGFRQHPDLDLIICDVEMPTMNGFEFLGMRRRDSQLAKIPTFMLTSRSGIKHRNLATQLGADGYFTKPYVEQEFIIEVQKVLGNKNSNESATEQGDLQNNYPGNVINSSRIKQKTILIIDDSSALRRTLALSLENKDYKVLQGRDGLEGLDLLRQNLQINLVICDVEMPNMNGFEFLTSRRKEVNLTSIPVVMLTSRSNDKHRSLAISLGANGYFTKPYVEDQFLTDLDNFIETYSNNKS